jgi:hypothetical protein
MTTERIKLEISAAAKEELLRCISEIKEFEAIATVGWSEGGTSTDRNGVKKELPSGWCVGFYNPKDIPVEEIQIIAEIKFIFWQGVISERLNGKLLDVENEKFVVR